MSLDFFEIGLISFMHDSSLSYNTQCHKPSQHRPRMEVYIFVEIFIKTKRFKSKSPGHTAERGPNKRVCSRLKNEFEVFKNDTVSKSK